MARKTKTITIPKTDGNRDGGKHFRLTEFSAVRAEKWAMRAISAMANGGMDIPPEVVRMGLGAVVAAGFRGILTMAFADAEPLVDEMMQCVEFVPDPKAPDVSRPPDPEDIEEVTTLLKLRGEIIEIHTGFSIVDWLSKLGQSATTSPTPDTPTI